MPSIDRDAEEWDQGISEVKASTREMRAYTTRILTGADLNASSLAAALDADGRADLMQGRISRSLERSLSIFDTIDELSLRILVPEGGFDSTFIPYNAHQRRRSLTTSW